MTNAPNDTTLEETIDKVAQHARSLHTCMRRLMWAGLPAVLLMVAVTLVNAGSHRSFSDAQFLWMGILLLPVVPLFVWMIVEQSRLRKAFRGLGDAFPSGPRDVRQIASPSSIGPLLEGTLAAATIITAWDHKDIDSATALLGALLQSVGAEDKVVLTEDQRKRLEELVLPGRGDSWFKGTGGVGGKSTVTLQTLRGVLCPAAVGALGFLGDPSSVPVLERFAGKTKNVDLRALALQSVEQIRKRLP